MELLLYPFTLVIGLVGWVLSVAVFAFWIWMLIHCAVGKAGSTEKIAWLLVVFFGNFIGALLYFFIARKKFGR